MFPGVIKPEQVHGTLVLDERITTTMPIRSATALAHPNIAFIKYWGNREDDLRIPANGSLSMNLAGLTTRTRLEFDPALAADEFILNGQPQSGAALARVSAFLDLVRGMTSFTLFARVESSNDFPTGAGIASSAAAFAALAVAANAAAGLQLDERSLSRLARRGSGSAARSIPAGFVEWKAGTQDTDSYALSIAPPDYWGLCDCIAIVDTAHKPTGSCAGHRLAHTSPLQATRLMDAQRRLDLCRYAILQRDFEALTEITEQDCLMMHAIMMTSSPPLLYWSPATLEIIRQTLAWRKDGLSVCFTIDAGANIHLICPAAYSAEVARRTTQIMGVSQVITSGPGGAATTCD